MMQALALAAIAILGGSSSHGLDGGLHADSFAWFLGADAEIKYCYVRGADFPRTDAEVEGALARGFAAWKAYIDRKVPAGGDPALALTTRSRLVACDGSEDLRVYFGASDATVDGKLASFANPVGFACRLEPHAETDWNPGIVWVTAPKSFDYPDAGELVQGYLDWSRGEDLDALIRHELGHVFGVEHTAGTVMDPALVRALLTGGAVPAGIDDTRELIPCKGCVERGEDEAFNGRLGDGAAAQVIIRHDGGASRYELAVTHGGRMQKLPLVPEYPAYRPTFLAGGPQFRRPAVMPYLPTPLVEGSVQEAWPAKVTMPDGTQLTVFVERNARPETPLSVTLVDGATVKVLFRAVSSAVR